MTLLLGQSLTLADIAGTTHAVTFSYEPSEITAHAALDGAKTETHFFGGARVTQLDRFMRSVASSQGFALRLRATRQAGKTTSNNRIRRRLEFDHSGPISLSLNGGEMQRGIPIARQVAERLAQEATASTEQSPIASHPQLVGAHFVGAPGTESAVDLFVRLRNLSEDRPLVLIIDEGSRFMAADTSFLRAWRGTCSDRGSRVSLLLLTFFEDVLFNIQERADLLQAGATASSSINNAQRDHLSPFDGRDAGHVLTHKAFGTALDVSPSLASVLALLTGGNPMMAQVFGDMACRTWLQGAGALSGKLSPNELLTLESGTAAKLTAWSDVTHALLRPSFQNYFESFASQIGSISVMEVVQHLVKGILKSKTGWSRESILTGRAARKKLGIGEGDAMWLGEVIDYLVNGAQFFERRYGENGEPYLGISNLYLRVFLDERPSWSYSKKVHHLVDTLDMEGVA